MKLRCDSYVIEINQRRGYGKFCLSYITAAGKSPGDWFDSSFLDEMNAAWRGIMFTLPTHKKPTGLTWSAMGYLAYWLETYRLDESYNIPDKPF